jgi:hypothetical protein
MTQSQALALENGAPTETAFPVSIDMLYRFSADAGQVCYAHARTKGISNQAITFRANGPLRDGAEIVLVIPRPGCTSRRILLWVDGIVVTSDVESTVVKILQSEFRSLPVTPVPDIFSPAVQ